MRGDPRRGLTLRERVSDRSVLGRAASPQARGSTGERRGSVRRHLEPGGGCAETRGHFELRWFARVELESLIGFEDFEITDYWGSFQREPFGDASPKQVICAAVRGTA